MVRLTGKATHAYSKPTDLGEVALRQPECQARVYEQRKQVRHIRHIHMMREPLQVSWIQCPSLCSVSALSTIETSNRVSATA